MKKSEIYRLAQQAVVNFFAGLDADQKLEVLRELMSREDLAKYVEEHHHEAI